MAEASARDAAATYRSIAPLIARAEEVGDAVRCALRCPRSGVVLQAWGPLARGRGLADLPPRELSLLRGVRQLARAVLAGLGGAGLAREGAAPVVVGPRGDGEPGAYSDSERQAAIVLAFRSMAHRFVRDAELGWVVLQGRDAPGAAFNRQLELAPVLRLHDRHLLARLLVAVARADGKVVAEERRALAAAIPPSLGAVDAFMDLPPLRPDDLDRASRGAVRDTLVMLAWALALADEDLDPGERERVLGYAAGFKTPQGRALVLKRWAQLDLLGRSMEAGGEARGARQHGERLARARALADRIGLPPAEVERAAAALRQGRGPV